LVYTLEVKSCVGSTKASSEYIVFKGASIHQKDLYISTPGNNINNINSDKLLIILLFQHLEHLESLREKQADRLEFKHFIIICYYYLLLFIVIRNV